MKKKVRVLNTCQLVLNISLLIVTFVGFYFCLYGNTNPGEDFSYYYIYTGILCAIASSLLILPNIKAIKTGEDHTPKILNIISFVGGMASGLTFTASFIAVLTNLYPIKEVFDIEKGYIFFTLVIPVISIVNILFFQIIHTIKFKVTFLPLFMFLFYSLVILLIMTGIHFTNGIDAVINFSPYTFYLLIKEWADRSKEIGRFKSTYIQNIVTFIGICICAYGISILVWSLNRFNSHTFVGVEYEDYLLTNKDESKKTIKLKEEKENNPHMKFIKIDEVSSSINEDNKVIKHIYHISYNDRKLKTWKVKAEDAGRALKVFASQKEAVEFAKELIAKNGGSIKVHSTEGKIRKDYTPDVEVEDNINVKVDKDVNAKQKNENSKKNENRKDNSKNKNSKNKSSKSKKVKKK